MVARGDLGVELNPEEVPPLQKRIVEFARRQGKPVVVATQMLESMIETPMPTRAEVSDVANAVYDGADAVMLSAETAAGAWPEEAVTIMHRIAAQVEADRGYAARVHFIETLPDPTTADALSQACASIADTLPISGIIVFTGSGSTARRVARERPAVPMLVLTPSVKTARKLGLLWGAHAVTTRDIGSFEEMIAKGKAHGAAPRLRHGRCQAGDAGRRSLRHAGRDQPAARGHAGGRRTDAARRAARHLTGDDGGSARRGRCNIETKVSCGAPTASLSKNAQGHRFGFHERIDYHVRRRFRRRRFQAGRAARS